MHRAERSGGAVIAWPSGNTGTFHSNSGGGETECIGPRGVGEPRSPGHQGTPGHSVQIVEWGRRVHRAQRCGGAAIAWPSGNTGTFRSNSGVGERVHRAQRSGGAAIAWPSGNTGTFHSNSGGGETECIGPRGLGESDHSPA